MQYAEHSQEARSQDIDYARKQMEIQHTRSRCVCVVDPNKRCARARRCGFVAKIDGCASFVSRSGDGRSRSVATSCRCCARMHKVDCGWKCVMEVTVKEAQ